VTWNRVAQGCVPAVAPERGACGAGSLCAPVADTGYHICVASPFNLPCPSGAYSTRRVAYEGASDLRSCGACTCGAVSGAGCENEIDLYVNDSCQGSFVVVPQACSFYLHSPAWGFLSSSVVGGSCVGSTSPVGSATPTQPTTFCCLD
jgi:hypothetical protein